MHVNCYVTSHSHLCFLDSHQSDIENSNNGYSFTRCENTFFFLLLLWHTPLECCCVHNALLVVANSCLPPGRCKANVLLAKVCLHCTKPGVARSS